MADSALAGIGGAMQIIAPIHQGMAQKAGSDFNAQLAEQNAVQAEQQAAEEERRARIQSKKALGDIRAAAGASGITLEGSPEDILAESAMNAELDALNVRHKGALRSLAFKEEARLQRFYGKQAKLGGYLGGAAAAARQGQSAVAASSGGA